jgi:hypothetical protein
LTADALVVVQSVASRASLLGRLVDGVAPLDTLVVVDEGEKADPWRGYRRCLEAGVASGREHVAVVQDDAIPCFDFACHLGCVIEEDPGAALVLFLAAQPRLTAHAAVAARRDRVTFAPLHARDWLPAVAVCYPRQMCEQILEWSGSVSGRHSRSDDHMLGRWARETGARVLVTVPSLVQHPDDVPSVIGNGNGSHGRNPARVALHWDG